MEPKDILIKLSTFLSKNSIADVQLCSKYVSVNIALQGFT